MQQIKESGLVDKIILNVTESIGRLDDLKRRDVGQDFSFQKLTLDSKDIWKTAQKIRFAKFVVHFLSNISAICVI